MFRLGAILFSRKKILFIILFGVFALIAMQVNFSALVGAQNQFFTVFQFFGPISGAFLGPVGGVLSVLTAQVLNFFVTGKTVSLLDIMRLFPMVFAAYYFGTSKKKEFGLLVPLLEIALFVLHPVGTTVWFFSLFWLIPVFCRLVFPNNILAKSFGATFFAHAVGGAIWIYTIPMTAEQWVALIPVVIFERTLFAFGIAASFILMTSLLARVEHLLPKETISVNRQYDIVRMLSLK